MDGAGIDWRKKARRLAERFPLDRLHRRAVERLRNSPRGTAWAVACSGGADSVCLLLLLHAHFPERRAALRVLHFNHRLRGAESDADATAVETLARGLGLAFQAGVWETPPSGGASAEEARRARFGFFAEVLATENDPLLILGQQRDDIVESQLMALSRGGASASLAAPRPVSRPDAFAVRVRPLLDLGAEEIRRALRRLAIPWRDDASNASHDYYRNRVRHAVLPAWREVSPFDVAKGASAARALLEEDEEALEVWTDRVMEAFSASDGFPAAALGGLPRAVRRRALNRWLAGQGLRERLSAVAFEELMTAMEAKEAFRRSAGARTFLRFDGTVLRRESAGKDGGHWTGDLFCPAGAEVHLPGRKRLRVLDEELDPETRAAVSTGRVDPKVEAILDAAALGQGGVRVRPWREGDRYQPLGAPGARKLQDIFTDRKIGSAERRRLPVVCTDEGSILWSPGLPPADRFKIGVSTRRVVRLTYWCGGAT